MKKLSLMALLALGMFAISCGGEEEPMEEICTTVGMRYEINIKTILDTNCATAGCHESGGTATFPMGTFDEAKQAVSFGRIVGAINQETGFSAMPRGGTKLDQCTIDKITSWIDDGAPW